jgi:hypothetical protein
MKPAMIGVRAPWAGGSNGGHFLSVPPVEANEVLQVGRLSVTKAAGTLVPLRSGCSKARVLPAGLAAAAHGDLRT